MNGRGRRPRPVFCSPFILHPSPVLRARSELGLRTPGSHSMRCTVLFATLLAAGCGRPTTPSNPPRTAAAAEATAPAANDPAPAAPPADTPSSSKPSTPVSALTGKIYLPKDGGKWPAGFAPAPPAVE